MRVRRLIRVFQRTFADVALALPFDERNWRRLSSSGSVATLHAVYQAITDSGKRKHPLSLCATSLESRISHCLLGSALLTYVMHVLQHGKADISPQICSAPVY